jgi:hypothetical protein
LTFRAAKFAAIALGRRDGAQCSNAQNVGDSYTKSGTQTQMTDVLTCNGKDPCNQQVGHQISVAHTLVNLKSTTFTVSAGLSISIEVGGMFGSGLMMLLVALAKLKVSI